MPMQLKPDKIHFYAAGNEETGYFKVMVDPAYPEATETEAGRQAMNYIRERAHALVSCENTIKFVSAKHGARPQKITLDWTLC